MAQQVNQFRIQTAQLVQIEGITTGYLTCAESNIYLANTNCNLQYPLQYLPNPWPKALKNIGQPPKNPAESPERILTQLLLPAGLASFPDADNPPVAHGYRLHWLELIGTIFPIDPTN